MTISTAALKTQIAALVSAVGAVPDLDRATAKDIAGLRIAARATTVAIDAAVTELDPSIGGEDIDGINGIVSGAFPIDSIAALAAEQANIDQMVTLLGCGGYAGRIDINLHQATG